MISVGHPKHSSNKPKNCTKKKNATFGKGFSCQGCLKAKNIDEKWAYLWYLDFIRYGIRTRDAMRLSLMETPTLLTS